MGNTVTPIIPETIYRVAVDSLDLILMEPGNWKLVKVGMTEIQDQSYHCRQNSNRQVMRNRILNQKSAGRRVADLAGGHWRE